MTNRDHHPVHRRPYAQHVGHAMNDELLMMISDLRIQVQDGPDTVDMTTMVHHWVMRRTIRAYADVERVEDWLPVGTPKDWVLGELGRLSAFVTGDDT